MSNLATNLKDAVGQHPNRPALRCGDTVLTYADLDELSARVAGGLLAHGVAPGDRVGLALPDGPAFAVLYYGVLRVGAVAVTTNPPGRGAAPFCTCPDGHGLRLVFTSADVSSIAAPGTGVVYVPVGDGFLDQLVFWPQHTDIEYRHGEESAVVAHEPGGRAGSSAAVALTHSTVRADAFAAATGPADLTAQDTVVAVPPHFRAAGQAQGLNAAVLAGACLSVPPPVAELPPLRLVSPAAATARRSA